MDTLIGGGKEGKDVVPGGNVAGAVPQTDGFISAQWFRKNLFMTKAMIVLIIYYVNRTKR